MRKFKLVFVVMASIFFMPTQLSAQRSEIEKLQSMKAKYDSMESAQRKGEFQISQIAEFDRLRWEIDALENKILFEVYKKKYYNDKILREQKKKYGTNPNAQQKEELERLQSQFDSDLNSICDNLIAEGLTKEQIDSYIAKKQKEDAKREQAAADSERNNDEDEQKNDASKLRKKNGVLSEKEGTFTMRNGWSYTGHTFTMNDGAVFTGFFKEELDLFGDFGQIYEVKGNNVKLFAAEELTPYHGIIKYANGTTDEIMAGKSSNAKNKAAKAEFDAAMKSAKAGFARLKQKYGASVTNLMATGKVNTGYSITMLDEYIKVYNKYKSARIKAENGQDDPLGLRYYQPTTSEVLKYGKTAKRVKLGGTIFANEIVVGEFMIANGKIVEIYRQPTILAVKDL